MPRFLALIGILTAYSLLLPSLFAQNAEPTRQISLSETAIIEAEPDVAILDLAVEVEGRDAASIEEEAYQRGSALIKVLKEFGLQPEDYQSDDNSLYQQRWRDKEMRIARIQYEVRFRELKKLDDFRKAAVEAGVNSFRISSYENEAAEELIQQAAEEALKKAMESAKRLATVAGMQLGDPLRIQVNSQMVNPKLGANVMMVRSEAMSDSPLRSDAPSLNQTRVQYRSTIHAEFELYKQ